MINLRYHIVSLVAVFLALAVGVIAGTTVVDQGVVGVLESQSSGLRAARDAARAEAADLGEELDVWERFAELLAPARLDGTLEGVPVVLVTLGEVDDDLRRRTEEVVVRAKAIIAGRLSLTDRWLLTTEKDPEALAAAIGAGTSDLGEAGTALGRRLSRIQPVGPDLLGRLAAEHFVTLDGIGDRRFPPMGALVLVLAAVSPETGPDRRASVPLLRALSVAGLPVVLAEPMRSAPSLVDLVRRDASLRRRVGTIDHADTTPGRFAIVHALNDVRRGLTAPHYGTRGGATAVAPA